jgi:hypothetical protein
MKNERKKMMMFNNETDQIGAGFFLRMTAFTLTLSQREREEKILL